MTLRIVDDAGDVVEFNPRFPGLAVHADAPVVFLTGDDVTRLQGYLEGYLAGSRAATPEEGETDE